MVYIIFLIAHFYISNACGVF